MGEEKVAKKLQIKQLKRNCSQANEDEKNELVEKTITENNMLMLSSSNINKLMLV